MSKIISIIFFFLFFMFPFIVYSQACNNAISSTSSHLKDNNDGTVSDKKTGLVWRKCSEGQTWSIADNSCYNSPEGYDWKEALQRAENINNALAGETLGKTDWRVPNIKELASILELKCQQPSINILVFPTTLSAIYVSSSSLVTDGNYVWYVHFNDGSIRMYSNKHYSPYYVRLVRSRL